MVVRQQKFGKRLKEIFTIHAIGNDSEIDDSRTFVNYDSMDEAISTAKKVHDDYKKDFKKLEVSVCFDEYLYESGDILGEMDCLSLEDLSVLKKKNKW